MQIGKFSVGIFILIFLVGGILAECDKNQVDINSASVSELDEIVYIGEARAKQIIAMRPFDSIEDLIKINGIGEVTLQAIIDEDLACVGNDEEKEDEEKEEKEDEVKKEETKKVEITGNAVGESEEKIEKVNRQEVITLNAKDIKTEENFEEKQDKSFVERYSFHGLILFCVLLGSLFLAKRKKYENEFG